MVSHFGNLNNSNAFDQVKINQNSQHFMAESFGNTDVSHEQALASKNEMEGNAGEEDVVLYQNDEADKLVAPSGSDNEMGGFSRNFEYSGPI